jgi:U3 small nucleolar RNA-associated protein 14
VAAAGSSSAAGASASGAGFRSGWLPSSTEADDTWLSGGTGVGGAALPTSYGGAPSSWTRPPLAPLDGKPPLIAPSAAETAEAAEEGEEGVAAGGAGRNARKRARAGGGGGGGGAAGIASSMAASMAAELEAAAATDGLVEGASLLLPSAKQQRLLEDAFPESAAAEFAAEKARKSAEEAPKDETPPELPGWGSWAGMGARPDRRAEERKRTAAEARAQMLAEAAARRKDAALRHVILSEKRDKKFAQFTTAGVPFPFSNREQFERSLRHPLGREWNTAASHQALVAPNTTVVRGAIIEPLAMHNKHAMPEHGARRKAKAAA